MKNNLINEEIKRSKLLMGYKPEMTLTENEMKVEVNEVAELAEQTTKQFLNLFGLGLSKADDVAFSNSGKRFSDFLRAGRNAEYQAASNLLKNVSSKVGGIALKGGGVANSADEILNALKAGTITANGMSNLAKGMLKAGNLTGKLRTDLIDKAAELSVKKAQFADDLTEKAISKALKAKGYADDVADDIAVRIKSKQGGVGGNVRQKTTTDIDDLMNRVKPPKPEKWYEKLWANKPFKYGMIAAAGAGTLALLQWWFSEGSKDPQVQWIPGCLKIIVKDGTRGLTAQDLMKAAQSGDLSSLPIANPAMVDTQGQPISLPNSVFGKDGSFKSSKGNGDWSLQGKNIIVNQGGNTYYIDCSDTIEEIKPEPAPSPAPGGGCTQSSDFPFGYYQMNSMVGSVQNCVGARADNCMGPQTAAKIKQYLGLSETPTQLTKDIYDKVMAKCGGSTKQEVTPIKEPTQISGGVTGGNKPTSGDDDFLS
jgi:hypothetical protein